MSFCWPHIPLIRTRDIEFFDFCSKKWTEIVHVFNNWWYKMDSCCCITQNNRIDTPRVIEEEEDSGSNRVPHNQKWIELPKSLHYWLTPAALNSHDSLVWLLANDNTGLMHWYKCIYKNVHTNLDHSIKAGQVSSWSMHAMWIEKVIHNMHNWNLLASVFFVTFESTNLFFYTFQLL